MQRCFCFGWVESDDHALARSQSVGFDHYRKRELPQARQRFARIRDLLRAGRRNARALKEFFGEDFRAFQTRGRLGWTNNAQPPAAEFIYNPRH